MEKSTFVEMYLAKYGEVSQPDAEKLVKRFIELVPNIKNPDKAINGVLGYIKYNQKLMHAGDIADYIHGDMLTTIAEREAGNTYDPSTLSFWMEMSESNKLPQL